MFARVLFIIALLFLATPAPAANAVVRGGGERAFVTNNKGQVVLDITRDRVKPVLPGEGFGPKRPPTEHDLDLLDRVLGNKP